METSLILQLLAIAFLILCSAFFSGSETGLTSVSRARIFQLMKENNRRAALVSRLREEKESLIGAILLGNNLVNILASALATSLAISLWGEVGVAYATIVMTAVVLIFAEVMPKTYAIHQSEKVSLAVAPLVALLVKLFAPVTNTVKWFISRFLSLFGVDVRADNAALTSGTDLLRGTIQMHHQDGQVERQDRDMLEAILRMEDSVVEDIMVHRKNIEGIDITLPVADIIEAATRSSHSRLPIYEGHYEHIIGILHLKRLLQLIQRKGRQNIAHGDIRATLLKPWYIPCTTSLKDQLIAFRQRRQHFAMVIDEYGDLLGIVTLEDIIEEIVGEIDDESDKIVPDGIVPVGAESWLIQGNMPIRDINRHFDWELPEDEATTLAGLMLILARDIPRAGQAVEMPGFRLTAENCTPTQVTRIRIDRLEMPSDSGFSEK